MSHSVQVLRALSLLFYIGSEITEAKTYMNLVLSDFPSLSRVYPQWQACEKHTRTQTRHTRHQSWHGFISTMTGRGVRICLHPTTQTCLWPLKTKLGMKQRDCDSFVKSLVLQPHYNSVKNTEDLFQQQNRTSFDLFIWNLGKNNGALLHTYHKRCF